MCNIAILCVCLLVFLFFKQKTAYEMRISDWSSDVCSSDLTARVAVDERVDAHANGVDQRPPDPFTGAGRRDGSALVGDHAVGDIGVFDAEGDRKSVV